MSHLPTAEEQEWLLDELAELLARCGSDTFVAGPILTPDPRHFPDRWEPDAQGVFRMARRLLLYAGLGELTLVLTRERPPDDGHGTIAAWFSGIEGKACHFGIHPDIEQAPEKVAAAMAHEVAHAWRQARAVAVTDDRELDELLTDVTTVVLGFGVLATNAADRFRTFATDTHHHWQSSRLGYLPPQALAFLLAAQVRTRDGDARERSRIRAALERNQRATFDAALKALPPPAELRTRLGVGEPGSWPALPDLAQLTRPLDAQASGAIADLESEEQELLRSPRPVFRLRTARRHNPMGSLVPVGGLMFMLGLPIGILSESVVLQAEAGAGVLLALVGLFYMPRQVVWTCSDRECAAAIDERTAVCPGCAREFVASVGSRNEVLAREDALIDAGIVRETAVDEPAEPSAAGDGPEEDGPTRE